MEISKELEKDIYELQDKIGAALDYCLGLYKRHGDQPGWEMVEDKLNVAIGWAETPLYPISEEEDQMRDASINKNRTLAISNRVKESVVKEDDEQRTMQYQETWEEEAFDRFLHENAEVFSQAAHTLIGAAVEDCYAYNIGRKYDYDPEEYDEAMQRMRLAATELTDSDRELLSKLCRVASAAAASIDPNDETPAGHEVCRGDSHWFYRSLSSMVEQVLQEKDRVETV